MCVPEQLLEGELVFDCKNPYSYLRPDLPAGHSAERADIFEQAVKRERADQQDKDGPKMNTDFCNQTLDKLVQLGKIKKKGKGRGTVYFR